MFYGSECFDTTLAAPSGVCVETVGVAGVDAWESSVMVLARDLVKRLEHIEKTLGARYCWESLADGGICGREWARVLGRVDSWIRHAEKYLAENGGDRSAHQLVWGDCDEFTSIHAKIYDWQNWGV